MPVNIPGALAAGFGTTSGLGDAFSRGLLGGFQMMNLKQRIEQGRLMTRLLDDYVKRREGGAGEGPAAAGAAAEDARPQPGQAAAGVSTSREEFLELERISPEGEQLGRQDDGVGHIGRLTGRGAFRPRSPSETLTPDEQAAVARRRLERDLLLSDFESSLGGLGLGAEFPSRSRVPAGERSLSDFLSAPQSGPSPFFHITPDQVLGRTQFEPALQPTLEQMGFRGEPTLDEFTNFDPRTIIDQIISTAEGTDARAHARGAVRR